MRRIVGLRGRGAVFDHDGGRALRHLPAILLIILLWPLTLSAQPAPDPDAAADAGPVVALHPFPTTASPPPYQPPRDLRGSYARFRPLLRSTAEPALLKLGLEFGLTHGRVTEAQQAALRERLDAIHALIADDPAWATVPSSLPFCFDDQREPGGQYLMVTPPGADADTPVILYLHGFAANDRSQIYLLSRHLPEAIILAPAWPGSWAEGSPIYIDDMLKDATARLGFQPARPTLLGLADGGLVAFRVAGRRPGAYAALISLAMTPRQSQIKALPKSLPVLMINGKDDDRIDIAHARLRGQALDAHLDRYDLVELDADHFFLLTHPEAATAAIRRFIFPNTATGAGTAPIDVAD